MFTKSAQKQRSVEVLERSTWFPIRWEELKPGDVFRTREPDGHLTCHRLANVDGILYLDIRDWVVTENKDEAGVDAEPHDFDRIPTEHETMKGAARNPFGHVDAMIADIAGPLAEVARRALDLSGAPNFIAGKLVRFEGDEDPLEFVIRRWTGKTPEAQRRAAIARVDELLAKNSELVEEARAARRAQRAAELTRDVIADKLTEIENFALECDLECGSQNDAEERYKETIEAIRYALVSETAAEAARDKAEFERRETPTPLPDAFEYVYGRPVGELAQELGAEVERVLSKPLSHWHERNAKKNAAGLRAVDATSTPMIKVGDIVEIGVDEFGTTCGVSRKDKIVAWLALGKVRKINRREGDQPQGVLVDDTFSNLDVIHASPETGFEPSALRVKS